MFVDIWAPKGDRLDFISSLRFLVDSKSQLTIFNRIVLENLSVRDVEDIVRNFNEQPKKASDVAKKIASLPEEYVQLQNHLSNYFKSNIEFKRNSKGTGKIVIPFKSDEDLERILGIFDNFKA